MSDLAKRLLNRELSWLEFNRRVLALAEDQSLPLLDRVRFLSIFSSNLDEFFQVRVALLQAEVDSGVQVRSADGMTPGEQLAAIRVRTLELIAAEQDVFTKDLRPALGEAGIVLMDWEDLDDADRRGVSEIFDERIFPVLTPLAVDPAHPFPYVSDLSFNLAVLLRDPTTYELCFARLKVPPILDRFLELPDGQRFVPIEHVIAAHLDRLFPGMEIESHGLFRVTRDADLDIEEADTENLLLAVESGLHRRRRLSDAVRLETDRAMSDHTRDLLLAELELDREDLYVRSTFLDLASLRQLCDLDRPDLKYERWVPRTRPPLQMVDEDRDIFDVLRQGDVLVHHPYDSFESSVEAFLDASASDPDVLAIKHTIYRTSGPENPIVRTLIRAAQAGKQVVILVELKARFDEQSNIEWARQLEEAGVHVVYGLVGLKTHAKIILVVRREGDQIRRYCHVGTGNYNPETSRYYEDIGIFSSDSELGADLTDLFNQLTGYSREPSYRKLLVAPHALRSGLLELIEAETESPDGRIVLKVNHLTDPVLIDALYAAQRAGVEIDLVVRGICCLRPAVPGLSDRIRVRSILGRFLEHSRIFRFGSESRGYRYYIGSADLVASKLDRRVEVVTPVECAALQDRLGEILDQSLRDDSQAWQLVDRTWTPIPTIDGVRAQEVLQALAVRASGPS